MDYKYLLTSPCQMVSDRQIYLTGSIPLLQCSMACVLSTALSVATWGIREHAVQQIEQQTDDAYQHGKGF
jgi:hypothetical protein